MSNFRSVRVIAAAVLAGAAGLALAQTAYPGIGRTATPKEVQAWDIDVRPDLKGLPKGAGTVAQGQVVWEAKCASCHGIFGESNQVFSPLMGGTTKDDVKTGHVARLNDNAFPGRTTLMKVATISTLWDYINRAMPWNAPKSLSPDEVYAVTAYLLNLGGVLPDNFELSDRTMAQAQGLLPNRNGMSTQHGLWPGKGFGNGGKPDVVTAGKPCMTNCAAEPQVASLLPDHARNNHGNLADQQRVVGPQRGAVTSAPSANAAAQAPPSPSANALALAQKHNCTACHGVDQKIVGPALRDIAARHASRNDLEAYLAGKIAGGGEGVWGAIPMPPQPLSETDTRIIAKWLAAGAPKP